MYIETRLIRQHGWFEIVSWFPPKFLSSPLEMNTYLMLMIRYLISKTVSLPGIETWSKLYTLVRAEILTLSHNQKHSFVIECIFKTLVSIFWRLVHVKRLCLFVYHFEIHHVKSKKMKKIELTLKWIGGGGGFLWKLGNLLAIVESRCDQTQSIIASRTPVYH